MSRVLPRAVAGALELLPREQIAFQRFLATIRRGFERFGFLPVETPVMESVEVLLTKSGGETEKQVYFVQSTGSLAQGKPPELALRFDLTVPLARYVAEHENELTFPFRRYQMQRVYRGERRQRGRFREFYQCDIDVVGKDELPLEYDAEIPVVIHHVFTELQVGKFTILLNNRKLLGGYLESLGVGEAERQAAVVREIDKLDKRGAEAVLETLAGEAFGLDGKAREGLGRWFAVAGGNAEVLAELEKLGKGAGEMFATGLAELRQVLGWIAAQGVPEGGVQLRPSLARGLDYYTGTVYETVLDEHPEIGSVCSGGRYDDLASHYTRSHLPGVGISIGATRLFDQLRQLGLAAAVPSTVEVLVTRQDEAFAADYLALAARLRAAGLNTEVYFGTAKLGKQMKYADRAGIRFVVIMGGDEKASGQVLLRDLAGSDQEKVAAADLAARILERRSGPDGRSDRS